MSRTAICVVVLLAACKGGRPPAGTASGSAPNTNEPGTAPDKPPAGISADAKATLDLYVSAFETLGADLAASAPDCAKAVAAVQRNAKELDALEPRRSALSAQLESVTEENRAAAGDWMAKTYAPRVKVAVDNLAPLMASCKGNPELEAAMTGVMERYPMMKKKKTP